MQPFWGEEEEVVYYFPLGVGGVAGGVVE